VLLSQPSPSRGLPTASVTIVEFGDFECLFCKRFHGWAQSLTAERADFRLVFKHLPLQGHPWARDAAAFAACAEMQSGDAFWRPHDFFYTNQATLTAENLASRAIQELVPPAVDGSRLLNCVHRHQADVRIDRDIRLANQLGIKATPTVFVNGAKGGDLRTIEQLRDAIRANGSANPRPLDGIKSINR
jgi:protein-disulfide isomerase